tara:strand:- start:2311 stop:3477 length:1167 start_codon:yes stop_codon:yes gene_type:complete
MAIKLTVEYVNLQASTQTQEASALIESAQSSSPSLSTGYTKYSASVSNQVIAPLKGILLSYIKPHLSTNYTNLNLKIFVDSDSKNLYFLPGNPNAETITVQEQVVFSFNNVLSDQFSFSDLTLFSVSKGFPETVNLSESSVISSDLVKQDQVTMSESHSFGLSNVAEENISVSDITSLATSISEADTFSFADTSVIHPNLGKTETLSMSESLSRVVSFNRDFTDSFTLDDRASLADPLQTDSILNKDNITTLSEEHIYNFSKVLSDSYSFSDELNFESSKPISESFSISEQKAYLFSTPRTDAFSLSDSPVKSPGLNKAESISFSDELNSFQLGVGKTESVSLSETDVISLSKVDADSLSVTESISFQVTYGITGGLNTSALNTGVLN